MSKSFFGLASPGDMLRKAEREFERLNSDLSVDNVFNFFVTAFHVKDYVTTQRPELKQAVKAFIKEPDICMCDFMCNKGKHMELTQPASRDKDADLRRRPGFAWGGAAWGRAPWGAGPHLQFFVDGKEIDVRALAGTVLKRWRQFFADNGIA